MSKLKLEFYCRNCCHMTKPIGEPEICMWCHSANIGSQPALLNHRQPMGTVVDPKEEPTFYDRLVDGFNMLHQSRME